MPVVKDADIPVKDHEDALGHARVERLSDAGDLTQFGALRETLYPGARSSICHWHSDEDEFVYVLDGEVTLHEDGEAITLHPGQSACFKANDPKGHFLENQGDAPATYLIVGTRSLQDTVTYPDDDRILKRDRSAGTTRWTTHSGTPSSNPYDEG